MGAAAPVFTVAMGAIQYEAQGEIGKINERINNRNALVLEGQADQLEQKAEFDIARFEKNFEKIEGETKVALAKSGVVMDSGSAYNIMLSNAYEAKLQENLIRYNSAIAAANKKEQANFARIEGAMRRNEAKLAQIQTVATTGANLYSMMNKPKGVA
jgi:hypothetical protein